MVEVCKVCGDPDCLVFSRGGYHCQNKRGEPPAKCFGWKEKRRDRCNLCVEAGYYSEAGSDAEPRIQFSQRTPQQTQRYEPSTPTKKKRVSSSSVSAVATVVSNNIDSYWDHLKQAKEAFLNEIITQEDYDDLKDHFLKKLKEM